MGRITRNLELRYSTNNMAVLKLNVAVNRRKKGESDFINCIAFDKNAENIAKFFDKGNMIAIIGHIQTGSYDGKDGKKVYTTDIVVDEWDFTGEKKSDSEQQHSDSYEQPVQHDFSVLAADPTEDDGLPF